MTYASTVGGQRHVFGSLAALMAQASPLRSGDLLAGLAPPRARRASPRNSRWPICRSAAFSRTSSSPMKWTKSAA